MSGWRQVLLLIALVALWSPCATAFDASFDLTAEGWVDALVAGLEITAGIGGHAQLQGEIAGAVSPDSFVGQGPIFGFGARNLVTLVTEGWVLLDASGQLASGDSITIQSLVYTRRQGLITLPVGELIEVSHYTQIRRRQLQFWWELALGTACTLRLGRHPCRPSRVPGGSLRSHRTSFR